MVSFSRSNNNRSQGREAPRATEIPFAGRLDHQSTSQAGGAIAPRCIIVLNCTQYFVTVYNEVLFLPGGENSRWA